MKNILIKRVNFENLCTLYMYIFKLSFLWSKVLMNSNVKEVFPVQTYDALGTTNLCSKFKQETLVHTTVVIYLTFSTFMFEQSLKIKV